MFRHGLVWLRRDLRFDDHSALIHASENCSRLSLIFIFDENITESLSDDDERIAFIKESLMNLALQAGTIKHPVSVFRGKPELILPGIISDNKIDALFFNEDYEPYAVQRDRNIISLCGKLNIHCRSFKDQVIFNPAEILKDDQSIYKVFTPYKNKWISRFETLNIIPEKPAKDFLSRLTPLRKNPHSAEFKIENIVPSAKNTFAGGETNALEQWRCFLKSSLRDYDTTRNFPSVDGTSRISPHLRFGTISIRRMVHDLKSFPAQVRLPFLNELIWREFFMMILYHCPRAEKESFKESYMNLAWSNRLDWFERWCLGQTGYPLVDAGMRQMNQAGWMHNRVRMITASFLVKHLHIDWRWGERYFAEKLFDYELSSNNGNCQWAAGTGADAAPYFRIFHPVEQGKKFDPDAKYIKRWIPELSSVPPRKIHDRRMYKNNFQNQTSLHDHYPPPIADLDEERLFCLASYGRLR